MFHVQASGPKGEQAIKTVSARPEKGIANATRPPKPRFASGKNYCAGRVRSCPIEKRGMLRIVGERLMGKHPAA